MHNRLTVSSSLWIEWDAGGRTWVCCDAVHLEKLLQSHSPGNANTHLNSITYLKFYCIPLLNSVVSFIFNPQIIVMNKGQFIIHHNKKILLPRLQRFHTTAIQINPIDCLYRAKQRVWLLDSMPVFYNQRCDMSLNNAGVKCDVSFQTDICDSLFCWLNTGTFCPPFCHSIVPASSSSLGTMLGVITERNSGSHVTKAESSGHYQLWLDS